MKLNVKQLSGDQFFVEIEETDSVYTLKSQIEQLKNIEICRQRLIFSARELIDSKQINEYPSLIDGKTIHLVIRRNIDIEQGRGEPTTNEDTLRQPLAQPIDHNINNNNDLDEEGIPMIDVMEMSRSCRLIKIFALIDCALMIVFAIYNQFFLIGVPLAICGFIGAKKLQRIPLVLCHYKLIYILFVYNRKIANILQIHSLFMEYLFCYQLHFEYF